MFRRHNRKLLFLVLALVAVIIFPLAALAMTYQVQPGDSLWQIARRFGTSIDIIKNNNNLSGDTIYPGQKLYIPDGVPANAPDYSSLKKQIEDFLATQAGTYGVYFKDLISGQSFGINADMPLPAASTVKLPTVLFINHLVAQGNLDWQQKLTYNSTTDYQGGSGILQFSVKDGDRLTLRTLTTLAITTSDNIAYNMLRNFVGKESVAAFMRSLGGQTVFPNGQNLSTARDMATYVQAALDFAKVNPDGRRLLDDMANGIYNEGIPLKIPDGVTVAHKEGFIWGSPDDVGVVFGSRPFIVTVLSQGVDDPDQGFANIATITRMMYDYQENL
ncbi:serine hydrolase [Neomoorella humiferrea]|uniref:Putative endopeptidase p60 n=1 Tax=Neomoorella humiferrea TaxID=676965 RepID=A0A2T0AM18_9FIRM|nr:serine hydrolase [Moorella humiferrea]PRR69741.1 putative endopeptidase p60 precursor [Moorella humiferrea]